MAENKQGREGGPRREGSNRERGDYPVGESFGRGEPEEGAKTEEALLEEGDEDEVDSKEESLLQANRERDRFESENLRLSAENRRLRARNASLEFQAGKSLALNQSLVNSLMIIYERDTRAIKSFLKPTDLSMDEVLREAEMALRATSGTDTAREDH